MMCKGFMVAADKRVDDNEFAPADIFVEFDKRLNLIELHMDNDLEIVMSHEEAQAFIEVLQEMMKRCEDKKDVTA